MEEKTTEENKKTVKCNKCNYTWKTRSKLFWITCPKCQLKFEISKK